ncbi:MAG TPA: transposase [Steroidobacteraceae bacterium]|nr:transposase [Steroidobacteraceae bacterium]
MQRLQVFRYELRPNGEQKRHMGRFAGSRRFVYNKALALQRAHYEAGGAFIGYVAMAKLLTEWRHSAQTPWLKDAPVHPLQHALKDLERAYRNFFDQRGSFPRFKRKGRSESFRYPDAKQFQVDEVNSRIKLPKLGWVRYRNSREVLGVPRNITLSASGGKWYASIQTMREVEPPVPSATGAVGIDVGIARFATLSDGSFVAPLNSFRTHEAQLRRSQRALSRKIQFSQNWRKAKRRVQRIHSRIGNCRRDFLHKATTLISKNHAMVCIEDLQVRNMSRSAKGNAQQAGKHVRAKSGLNKSILDQGWSELRRQLQYKLDWNGGILVAVPPHNTSRTCPDCDRVTAENRPTQAHFKCVCCGYENHADVVGAINVLARGHRVVACGEEGSGLGRKTRTKPASVKQEPTEVTMGELAHA